jgi:hypothetical protein
VIKQFGVNEDASDNHEDLYFSDELDDENPIAESILGKGPLKSSSHRKVWKSSSTRSKKGTTLNPKFSLGPKVKKIRKNKNDSSQPSILTEWLEDDGKFEKEERDHYYDLSALQDFVVANDVVEFLATDEEYSSNEEDENVNI